MTPARSTWLARESLRVLFVALAVLAGCGGARRPKISGPPPEYEQPDLPDASPRAEGVRPNQFEPPGEPRRDASAQ